MRKKRAKQGVSLLLAMVMFVSMAAFEPRALAVDESPASVEYELYPIPQTITYQDSAAALPAAMNVFYGTSIDQYTKARAVEAFKEVGITLTETPAAEASVLVGVSTDNDEALSGIGVAAGDEAFSKIDGYCLKIAADKIYVVGRHTDAAFYGLTTLLQIFQQVDDSTRQVRQLDIKDWADVASRGFIEGYYGNPWSVEDRSELMRWGGYYKLNSYFYAPKDDPKHNAQWRALYTDQELQDLIAPLAKVGNESKCQFVFALHPFMSNPINASNYDASVKILKEKFEQTMKYGVRQIAVLADDAGVPGGDNATGWELQTRLMKELVDWVSSDEMQQKYPGLKTTVPFCPNAYMYGGGNAQLKYFGQNMPTTVPLVVTGGKVWGEVSQNFTQSFTQGVGRGPYLWINWPCSDNSKRHLIMGGYTNFLQVGVQPQNIQGIILNPMQQSEPSKVAIFGNACYSWHIWTKDEADQAWIDSFKYVDHESYEETPASTALREMSKHMINQAMDSRVVKLEESVEIKDLLTRARNNLNSGAAVAQEDITALKEIFTTLKEAASRYKDSGNERIRNQIVYWLDSWLEVTEANLKLLDALEAIQNNGDSSLIVSNYTAANSLYEASNKHGFSYVNSTQYAEVGVQHIQPFTKALLSMVGKKVELILDPTLLVETPIHSFSDAGTNGNNGVNKMLDNDSASYAHFARQTKANDYVGVLFSRKVDVDRVAILTGTSATDNNDCLPASKLEYTTDGKVWQDVPNGTYAGGNSLRMTELGLKGVMGIRAYTTDAKQNWLAVREIQINEEVADAVQGPARLTGTAFKSDNVRVAGGNLNNILDGNTGSYVHLAENPQAPSGDPGRDKVPAEAYIGINFGEVKKLGRVQITQAGGDKITDGVLEYSTDGVKYTEVPGGAVNGNTEIDLSTLNIEAQYIRIRNKTRTNGWVQIYEFIVEEANPNAFTMSLMRTSDWILQGGSSEDNLFDGSDSSFAYYDPRNGGNNDISLVDDYIGVDLGKVIEVGEVRFVVGKSESGDKWTDYKLEYSTDNNDWKVFKTYTGVANGQDIVEENLRGAQARYVRLTNTKQIRKWLYFSEISVEAFDPTAITVDFMYKSDDATVTTPMGKMDDTHATVDAPSIVLPANAYIGIDLGRIRPVNSITVQHDGGDAITVKGGASRSQLATLPQPLDGVKNVRYIELVNTSGREVTINLTALTASYQEATGPVFLETTMGINAQYGQDDSRKLGTTGNLFDENLNTKVNFADYPATDGYILYDLGQTRDISNLKLYVQDSDINFIRDGKVQVSMNKDSGWVDVITIGDGIENTDDADTTALNSGLYKASSTYPNKLYVEGSVAETQARYLRILFTAPYKHRFVNIYEIIVNDGEYMPEQNAAFTAVPPEQKGYPPRQVVDGSLTTGFRPNMQGVQDGYLIYRLSDVTDLEQINVVQDGTEVSASKPVTVYAKGSNTNGEFVQVGQMTEAVSNVPVYNSSTIGEVYELKFAWSGITPTIYEIYVVPRGIVAVDTSALTDLLNKLPTVDEVNSLGSAYNQALKAAYETAYTDAQALVVASPQYQAEVIEAQNKLNNSYDALVAVLNAARTKLADQIEAYGGLDLNKYTADSWSAYQSALSAAQTAQAKTGLTDIDEILQAYDQLVQAHDNLKQKSSEKKILSFDIANCETEIDEQTHTITVTAPAGTAVDNLVPVITVSDRAIVTPDSGAAQNFNDPVTYTVTAEDGSEQKYVVTVDVLPDGVYLIRKDTAVVNGVITIDRQSAMENETVQVTVDPVDGYVLKENGIKVYQTNDPEVTVSVEQDGTFKMPPYEVTVTAEFETIRYQITYQLDGGTNAPGNPDSYTVEDTLTLKNPTRDGFAFAGWTYEGMDVPTVDLTIPAGTVSGDLCFTAHWTDDTVATFTVTFNSNGGSEVPNQVVEQGAAAVEPNAPTKSGYRFDGWYTDSSLATAYDFNMPVTGDLTLYAKWTYVGGGSSSSSSDTTTETTKNPDGSTTITVTSPDGSTSETTKYTDGTTKVVETDRKGTVTTTTTDLDGNKVKVVQKTDGSSQITVDNKDGSGSVTAVDENGYVVSTASLSSKAIHTAEQSGNVVTVPIPEVPITTNQKNAPTVTVYLDAENSVAVEIPVDNVTPGTVAVLVKADGTEEIIQTSWTTENGVTAKLSDGDTVKIVDNSKNFIDVPSSHWGSDAVAFVSSRELFSGTSENQFSPETAMNRAMIVTVLARYEGVDTSIGEKWYDAGRQWAMEKDISDGSDMEGNLTREQLATMLYRYAGEPAVSGSLNGFADASSVSDYAKKAMAWAVENGLITGITNTTLAPQGEATRAQVAAILQRYVQSAA